jgi:hypothetical protein
MTLPKDDPITVTSRPLCDIDGDFRGARHILQLSVDDFSPAVVGHDNCAYMSVELEGLSGLGGKQPAALVEKGDELLGQAHLACKHIKAHHLTPSPLDFLNAVMTSNHGQQDDLLYNIPHHVSTEIFTNIMRMTALVTFCFVRGQVFCVLARANPSFSMRQHFPDGDDHYNADIVVTSMSPWKGTLL